MALQERLASLLIVLTLAAMLPQAVTAEAPERLSDAEIESLLAPVALYPDALLTQILIAATYPLDVVEAARFITAHSELEGSDAVLAAAEFDWDPSVQALTAFPEVLARMDGDLRWTRALGEAFLHQQEAVMVSLQTLRQRARLAGTLQDTDHLKIEQHGDRLALRAPQEDQVYVPWYDTTSAYGQWPSQQHQPVYWDPNPRHHSGFHIARMSQSPLFWGQAIHLDPLYYPTRLDWHRRGVIVVDRSHGRPWQHRARHHRTERSARAVARRPDFPRPESQRRDFQRPESRRPESRDEDRREQRNERRSWPEEPTASLSQQRAGAIDTRTATERLRALQAEAAAASEPSDRARSDRQVRRFERREQASQRHAPDRRSQRADAATTVTRPQAEGRTRSEPSRSVRRQEHASTNRSFGRGNAQHPRQSRSEAATRRHSAPDADELQNRRHGSPPRQPD